MTELAVQRFLRQHTLAGAALAELEQRFAIKARRHGEFPNLVLLKYDQIESPFREEIVQDCRGIILDERDNWAVVCMTYRKFFNLGETHAAALDWSTAAVYEKLDGSLIQLYYYAGDWRVATSGTPDANCQVGDFATTTFESLFWKTAYERGHFQREPLDPGYCYAFELCTPLNRVVVHHDKPEIWLHGVRRLDSLQEESPGRHAPILGVPLARTFPLQTAFGCGQAATRLNPLVQEGYVAVDGAFNRVKIKSPAYVALHHAKDGLLSRRMMANTIRRGESEELRTALDAFPELADEFRFLERKHDDLVYDAEIVFGHLLEEQAAGRIGPTRKDFAVAATKDPRLSGVLFHLLDHQKPDSNGLVLAVGTAVRRYFANLHEKAYARLVGLKDDSPKEIAA